MITDLEMAEYPGLSGGVQCSHQGPFKSRREDHNGDIMREAMDNRSRRRENMM